MPLRHGGRSLLLAAVLIAGRCAASEAWVETNSARVRAAFGEHCEPLVLQAIAHGQREIDVAVFSFARKRIAQALIDAARRGVRVRLKLDALQADFEYTGTLIERMRRAGIGVRLVQMPADRHMHHKFAVIDRRIVITGSFNWTRTASEENWENVVAIRSKRIAAGFRAEWRKVKDRSEEDLQAKAAGNGNGANRSSNTTVLRVPTQAQRAADRDSGGSCPRRRRPAPSGPHRARSRPRE